MNPACSTMIDLPKMSKCLCRSCERCNGVKRRHLWRVKKISADFLAYSRQLQRSLYAKRKPRSSFSLLFLETGSLEEDIESESSNVRWIFGVIWMRQWGESLWKLSVQLVISSVQVSCLLSFCVVLYKSAYTYLPMPKVVKVKGQRI